MKAPKSSSLYRGLLAAFASIISMLLVLTVVFVALQGYIIHRHTVILSNLLYEGELAQGVPKVINAFYGLTTSYSEEGLQDYRLAKANLEEIVAKLDVAIVDEKSRVAYIGVRNIIRTILVESEEGLQAGLKGDLTTAAQKYDSALQNNIYIERNSVGLVLAEMQYADTLISQFNRFNTTALYSSIVLLVLILASVFIFVQRFSRQMSQPLVDMAVSAGKIESGDFNVTVDSRTLARSDELGVLGKSFNTMAIQLKSSIEEIKRSNASLEESKVKVEDKNKELEKLNHFMVDRELKMVELKGRIKELEEKK